MMLSLFTVAFASAFSSTSLFADQKPVGVHEDEPSQITDKLWNTKISHLKNDDGSIYQTRRVYYVAHAPLVVAEREWSNDRRMISVMDFSQKDEPYYLFEDYAAENSGVYEVGRSDRFFTLFMIKNSITYFVVQDRKRTPLLVLRGDGDWFRMGTVDDWRFVYRKQRAYFQSMEPKHKPSELFLELERQLGVNLD